MKKIVLAALMIGFVVGFAMQSAFATPYCHRCPYDCSFLGLGHKDCSEIDGSRGSCCVDLTQKGLDVARARDRGEDNSHPSRHNDSYEERCPSGFQPSEQKCSQDERRRGCKDIRLPNGLGCVKR